MGVDDELKKLLDEDEDTSPLGEAKGEEPKGEPAKAEQPKSEEEKKKEQLANLERAIAEANDELRKARELKKAELPKEDDTPKINFEDPSAKAWDKHIKKELNPLEQALEKEKTEVVGLALTEFLKEKPELAGNAKKRREFFDAYRALAGSKGITERNKDVILDVMGSAYGAVTYQESLERERKQRFDRAKAEGAYAESAIDGGETTYRNETGVKRRALSRDEAEAAVRMYGSIDNYWKAIEAASAQ